MSINHDATASTEPILEPANGRRILMSHHARELLEGSGLNAETIKAAGIYSEWTPAKLARLLKLSERTTKRMVPVMVFPWPSSATRG